MQRYLIAWNVFTIAISTLLALPKMYNIPILTPTLLFWIHKLTYFFFTDVFLGIIIPLNMIIPLDLDRPKVGEFYVRKPKIEPRRSQAEEIGREFLSKRDGEMGKSKRRRQRRIREEEDAGIMELCDVQPSTSYQQQTQTLTCPTVTSGSSSCLSSPSPPLRPSPLSLNLSFRRVLQVQPASCTPEPLSKVLPKIEPRRTQAEEPGREFLSRRDGEMGKSKRRHQRRTREDAGIMELHDAQPSSSGLYDVQPSGSYEQSRTISSPTPASGTPSCHSTPSPLLQHGSSARFSHLSFRRVLQVQPASCTPEPLPKVYRKTAFQGGRRRSTTYCRTCTPAPRKGKEVADDPT